MGLVGRFEVGGGVLGDGCGVAAAGLWFVFLAAGAVAFSPGAARSVVLADGAVDVDAWAGADAVFDHVVF